MTDMDIKQRLDNLWAFLNEEGWYTKANTAYLAKEEIENLEKRSQEQSLQYLSDTGQLGERIGELTEVLEAVDAWVEDLGYYADEGAELAPVFKKVKAVLGRGYK